MYESKRTQLSVFVRLVDELEDVPCFSPSDIRDILQPCHVTEEDERLRK